MLQKMLKIPVNVLRRKMYVGISTTQHVNL